MANLNAPSGLSPVMYRNGNFWNGQARLYGIIATDTNPCYIGDVVKIDATNFADTNGIPYVTRATAGATARGVVVAVGTALPYGYQGGPYINPNDLTKTYRPASAQSVNYYVAVVDDPDVIFEIQEDTTSTPGLAAQMNKNANFTAANPATGVFVSGFTLNSNTYATTATLNLKVLQAVQRSDNQPFTAYQKLLVLLNNHDFSGGVAGY
jgi:hypothetical protein